MTEVKALEANQVLLWGLNPVKKSLLEQYDKGNKNPNTRTKKERVVDVDEKPSKKKEEKKVEVKRVFNLEDEYNVNDLPFLNDEYERIENELSSNKLSDDEYEEYEELQDKLYTLIEGLEAMAKMEGKGFKKGSEEAKAHAEKMRKKLEEVKPKEVVKTVKEVKETKKRVEKGSEEAKALGKKLAEARARKKAEQPKEIVEEITTKKRPYYYIGDIPKGHREATEDEAILNNKVSYYGKYKVDETKYELFKNFKLLLTTNKTTTEINWMLNGIKKRVMASLREIYLLKSQFDSEKYKDKLEEISNKLELEKNRRKYLQAGWNWYYKLYCERTGKKFEKQKFEYKPEIVKVDTEKPIYKEPVKIDPRTNKKVDREEEIREMKNAIIQFTKDGQTINLKRNYFDEDFTLYPKYVNKLNKMNIQLDKEYYPAVEYNKMIYQKI